MTLSLSVTSALCWLWWRYLFQWRQLLCRLWWRSFYYKRRPLCVDYDDFISFSDVHISVDYDDVISFSDVSFVLIMMTFSLFQRRPLLLRPTPWDQPPMASASTLSTPTWPRWLTSPWRSPSPRTTARLYQRPPTGSLMEVSELECPP